MGFFKLGCWADPHHLSAPMKIEKAKLFDSRTEVVRQSRLRHRNLS
ncbi:hypothetical protein SLEP1_g9113 [Rubroshorea leprosula]|uniref:Uncharacterized protein n=1 Tax=Rubroshorea leprosula TaxID=152421 RepID=A0AAV5IDQ5_9ROSI|nr:hypothetical protein SLEP1_g9113 [Rubroshorea leprosula]